MLPTRLWLLFDEKIMRTTLLRNALERTWAASDIIGIRGLLVHALSPAMASFYARHGFTPSPTNPLTLVMPLKRPPK